MDNEIELIKVRAERDEAIKAWKVSCEDVKQLMAGAAEIRAVLEAFMVDAWCGSDTNRARAKKALEPVYKPLLDMNTICSRWPVLGIQPLLVRSIGADTMEAAADRMESRKEDALFAPHAVRDLREWSKAERAIGS